MYRLSLPNCEINDLSLKHKPFTLAGTSLIVSNLLSPKVSKIFSFSIGSSLNYIDYCTNNIQYHKGRVLDVQTDNVEVSVFHK